MFGQGEGGELARRRFLTFEVMVTRRERVQKGGMSKRRRFFWRWLVASSAIVVLFGAIFLAAPKLTYAGFEWLFTWSHSRAVPAEARLYVEFVYGVLGAVLVGWGTTFLFVLFGPFRRDEASARWAWWAIAVPLVAWAVPDTIWSCWTGYWPNAVLNAGFVALFAPPLVGAYGGDGGPGMPPPVWKGKRSWGRAPRAGPGQQESSERKSLTVPSHAATSASARARTAARWTALSVGQISAIFRAK